MAFSPYTIGRTLYDEGREKHSAQDTLQHLVQASIPKGNNISAMIVEFRHQN
jgi:hypothetical protein